MAQLEKIIQDEIERLKRLEKQLIKRKDSYPSGKLLVRATKKRVNFYFKKDDDKNDEKYIRKKDLALAQQLAQKSYDADMAQLIEKKLKQLLNFQSSWRDEDLGDLFKNLHPARKDLVKPIELPWETLLSIWKNQTYEQKGFEPYSSQIFTKKGERVRSKSERMLANSFYDYNIDYLYEKPLRLSNRLTFWPDFTFLSKRLRKEIYWEHLGLMGDENYARKALNKISTYEKYGISLKDRLIITMESNGHVLDSRLVDSYIHKFLLEE